jgi:hypothetical protein
MAKTMSRKIKFVKNNHREHRSKKGRDDRYRINRINRIKKTKIIEDILKTMFPIETIKEEITNENQ